MANKHDLVTALYPDLVRLYKLSSVVNVSVSTDKCISSSQNSLVIKHSGRGGGKERRMDVPTMKILWT